MHKLFFKSVLAYVYVCVCEREGEMVAGFYTLLLLSVTQVYPVSTAGRRIRFREFRAMVTVTVKV